MSRSLITATLVACLAAVGVAALAAPALAQEDDLLDRVKKLLEESRKNSEKAMEEERKRDLALRESTGVRVAITTDATGARVAAVDPENRIELWLDDDAKRDLVIADELPPVQELVFDTRRDRIYASCENDTVHVFDVKTGKLLVALGTKQRQEMVGGVEMTFGGISDVTLSPDGRYLVYLGGAFGGVDIFDRTVDDWIERPVTNADFGAHSVSFLADSQHVLVSTSDGIELQDLAVPAAGEDAPKPVWAVAGGRDDFSLFDSDKKKKAKPLGSGYWHTALLEKHGVAVTLSMPILDDDGKKKPFLSGWSTKTGKRKFRASVALEFPSLLSAPDSDLIFVLGGFESSASPRVLYVHSGRHGKRIRVLKYPKDGPQPRAISPDGKTGFDVAPDGTLQRFSLFPVAKKKE